MPEGDTVWNTAQVLHRAIGGSVLTGCQFRVPALATTDLTGWTVVESASRGKHLLLRLRAPARPGDTGPGNAGTGDAGTGNAGPGDAGPAVPGGRNARDARWTLHSHLRMDGSWRVYAPDERWRGPVHTVRVVLRTATAVAVGYHLHDLALVPAAGEDRLVGHLGPDLLGEDWDPAEALRRLRREPDRAIAEALMDQRNLAGIGNLYKSESLFLHGTSPWTPVAGVADLPRLVERAHRLLVANRGRWTQSTTGSLRRGHTTYVFERTGLPCRRCGTPIRRDRQGERITYWCGTCQPGPAPRGTTRPTLASD